MPLGYDTIKNANHPEQEVGRVLSSSYTEQSTFTHTFSEDCRILAIANSDDTAITLSFKDANSVELYNCVVPGYKEDVIAMHEKPFRKITFVTELGHDFVAKGMKLK